MLYIHEECDVAVAQLYLRWKENKKPLAVVCSCVSMKARLFLDSNNLAIYEFKVVISSSTRKLVLVHLQVRPGANVGIFWKREFGQ